MEDGMSDELERLRRENAELRRRDTAAQAGLRFKVSEKGCLSVYGMGRFPVSLYKEQWRNLMDHREAILEFIDQNDSSLKTSSSS